VSFDAKSTCLPLNKISRQDRLISNIGLGVLVIPYLGIHPKKNNLNHEVTKPVLESLNRSFIKIIYLVFLPCYCFNRVRLDH